MPRLDPPLSGPDARSDERVSLGQAKSCLRRAAQCIRLARDGDLTAGTRGSYDQMARAYEGLADDLEATHASRVWQAQYR